MFSNEVLMITGGAGSFGNAVPKSFLNSDIAEIRVLSRDEKKQDDMRERRANSKLKYYTGDVCDYRSLLSASRGVDPFFNNLRDGFQ